LAHFFGAGEGDGLAPPPAEDARARLSERIQQLEELSRAQENPTDWSALASTCERLVSLAAQAYDSATEARALARLGRARIHLGEFGRAVDSLNRASNLFAAAKDVSGEADARQALGHAFLSTGRTSEAREQFSWIANCSHAPARWAGAVSLAGVDEQSGDYRSAMARCDEAAALLEQAYDAQGASSRKLYIDANRVNLYLACGDFKTASNLAERCLTEAEGLGNGDQHLEARLNLGVCALHQGKWAVGYRALNAALSLARFVGDKSREAMTRSVLSQLLAAMGDFDNAVQQAKDALSAALSQGDHRAELFAQMGLTDAYSATGRDSEARYHANQGLAVAASLRLILYQAECRLRLARLSLRGGDLQEGVELVQRALADAEKLGARHVTASAHLMLARCGLLSGDLDGAFESLGLARDLATDLDMLPVIWETDALCADIARSRRKPDLKGAGASAERAVAMLELLRGDLRDGGAPDTVLENRHWQDIYLLRANLMAAAGNKSDADGFIQQVGWPPLTARFASQGM